MWLLHLFLGRDGKLENEDRQVQTSSDVSTSLPPPAAEDNNNVSGNTVEVPTSQKDIRQHTHHHPMGHSFNYADVGNGKGLCHFAEFPPAMLAHLYQEELLKLIGKKSWKNVWILIGKNSIIFKTSMLQCKII